MPSRIIREGIITSARVNSLSMGAELLYRRLMSVADDYGRFHGSPATILCSCWPTCPDRYTPAQVVGWLAECCQGRIPLVVLYEVDGLRYLQITEFKQQTRSKSKFPDPTVRNFLQSEENALLIKCSTDDKQMQSKCEANAQPSRSRISESESNAESESEYPPTPLAGGLNRKPPRRNGKRTTEQITAALGETRMPWWEAFWKVYPCHDGMNLGMDAFERKVDSRDLAEKVYRGAVKYAAKLKSDPTIKAKYAQGWINDERWEDENLLFDAVAVGKLGGAVKTSTIDRAMALMQERIDRGERPL